MPKKLGVDYKYAEKLAKIRRDNVKRHAGYEASTMLRKNIQRNQQNNTYQMEYDRLMGARTQGHLAAHAEKRLLDLKN